MIPHSEVKWGIIFLLEKQTMLGKKLKSLFFNIYLHQLILLLILGCK